MKILAIGAHFDDVELGCGGTLLKHRDAGDQIYILVVSHSGYRSQTLRFSRLKKVAKQEGIKSAKILGAKLFCCNKTPTIIIPTEKLVLDLELIVNKIQPDRVYTHSAYDCHADHAAIGFTSLRACRKCPEIFTYRSNWYIINGANGEIDDNYYVNISEYIEQKERLMRIFESEMKKVNYTWIDFVKAQNKASGAKVGVDFAETFRCIKMFWK
ncbi:MAG: N-acetylglycoside deacetylase, LmbE family [uncultured bacterium]|nr:MAG: N-acetylglycoside deacetylase, LmbE family [uncultured bacterium]